VEVFANNPAGTVNSGGTDAPAAGTSEAWTVNVTAAFAVASSTAVPATHFHIVDPAAPTEVMKVTTSPGGTGSGQSWTVTRGAEGSTPVTHAAGFTIVQSVTAGALQSITPVFPGIAAGTQDIDSTTPATVGDLSFPVTAGGNYYVRGKVSFTEGANGNAAAFRFVGQAGATVTGMSISNWFSQQSTTASIFPDDLTALGTDADTSTMVNGSTLTWWFEGLIQVGTAGTIALQARATGGSAYPFTINAYPLLYVAQVQT
jgi:hypothetical protein